MSFSRWPAPGILALYHLEDVNDSSGNSHTLTNGGTVTFEAGKIGNCAALGSSNTTKCLTHADGLGANLGNAHGISIWFMVQTAPSTDKTQEIVQWASTTTNSKSFLMAYQDSAGTKQLMVYCAGNYIIYPITLSLNVYYKMDLNIDSTCEAFLNGVSIGSASRGTTNISSENCVVIGARTIASPTSFFNGNIDEAVFFSVVRSAADIRRRYAFEKGMLV